MTFDNRFYFLTTNGSVVECGSDYTNYELDDWIIDRHPHLFPNGRCQGVTVAIKSHVFLDLVKAVLVGTVGPRYKLVFLGAVLEHMLACPNDVLFYEAR